MKRIPLLALTLLAGCGNDPNVIAYVCEEPLQGYLDRAHTNISNDYEIERSREVLATCPEKGFHRRYTFKFMKSALASKQSADAEITAIWCNDPVERVVQAELDVAPSILTFRFTYPWSTETGKYPRTEFRLHTSTLRGGFAKDLDWRCRLEQASAPPA